MCGRYTLISIKTLHDRFNLAGEVSLPGRYNIAPAQDIPAIRAARDSSGLHLELLRWGLIPPWAKDASIGQRMINARMEGIETKPSFRNAFALRRCLIPADGFYEWKNTAGRKQPYYYTLKDGQAFAFGGLWECWKDPESGQEIESCTILTTPANPLLAEVHDRMPLILAPDDYGTWLDAGAEKSKVKSLLRPYPPEEMKAQPVSARVNSPKNEGPACIEPERSQPAPANQSLFPE